DNTYRLFGILSRFDCGFDLVGQSTCLLLHRQAPVEGELPDLVGRLQMTDQLLIVMIDGPVGLNRIPTRFSSRSAGSIGQLIKAVDDAPPQPDPLVSDAKVAAEYPGKDEDRWSVRRSASGPRPCR